MLDKLKHLTHEIISGKKTIFYRNQRYTLMNPSLDIILEADLIYTQHYDNLLYEDNFFLLEEIDQKLIQYQIFFPAHQQELEEKNKELESFKKTLFQEYKDTKNRIKIQRQIAALKKNLGHLYNLKHYLDFLTLEKHCDNIRYEYIIANTFYDYNKNKLVFDYSDLYNTNNVFFNGIIDAITDRMIDISTLKQIVISEYWKNIYTNNKENIFPFSAIEYTEEQKSLINLSVMYDSIYQHPDCPDDEIIADEDALDGWMLIQKDKIRKEKVKKGVQSKMSSKVAKSDHVFIPTDGTPQEIQDINNLITADQGEQNGPGIQRFDFMPNSHQKN